MRTFAERSIPYLTVARATCEAAAQAQSDPAVRRKLEQVSQVLSALLSDARSMPALEARALGQMSGLLPQVPQNYASARTLMADSIASQSQDADAGAAEFNRDAVEIDAGYLRGLVTALHNETKPAAPGGQQEAGAGEMPSASVLSAYLSEVFAAPVEVTAVDTASLGFSKATYLLDIRASAHVPGSLVIRMDRALNFLGTTVIDEFPILKTLFESGVNVPQPFALEPTGTVLGQPFLTVSRVHGKNVGSHFTFPPRNLVLCRDFGATLARIHSIPAERFGATLRGTNMSAEQQVEEEIAHYHADWKALGAVSPTMEAGFQWIKQHVADAVGNRSLVHGDFSLSNALITDQGKIGAILDWEFTQWGAPAADIGWFYTAAENLASFHEFLDAYRAAGGIPPTRKQLDFFVLWGTMRLAVMNFQVETAFEAGRLYDIRQAYVAGAFSRVQVLRVATYLNKLLAEEGRS